MLYTRKVFFFVFAILISISQSFAFELLSADSPSRNNSITLDGQTVSGDIFVYLQPEEGVTDVNFFIDGDLIQSERRAPWDLGGTSKSGDCQPYDSTQLSDGQHLVTARISLASGAQTQVTANILVSNNGPSIVSSPTKLSFISVDGSTALFKEVVLTESNASSIPVDLVSNAVWLTVSAPTVTTPSSVIISVDPSQLASPMESGQLTLTSPGYEPLTINVSVRIGITAEQLHLGWTGDPSTTLAVDWSTTDFDTPSELQFRPAGQSDWQTATGFVRHQTTDRIYHQAQLTNLSANTQYEYRVKIAPEAYSETYSTYTMPTAEPAVFDVVYMADTGLVGREDGLTTGTEQVINEVLALDPSFILLGGDYAYFNTDKRYGTLERSIDAWLDQMFPIAKSIPMMPTYGNHEVGSSEGFDEWSRRFSTPPGWNNNRMYSFDVGPVHFVNVYGWHESASLPQDALDWLATDLEIARNAGKRWIIPYFHAALFSDGTNHPSALQLRDQLAPIFEQWGVKVVLTAHDQSYERTYPLVNAAANITATSSSLSCYTLDDGVTYVKTSPGGKLSNISRNFSPWANPSPAPWIAKRNNTLHHFNYINFDQNNDLIIQTLGVDGSGSAPILIDTFRYTTGECPPEIFSALNSIAFSLQENESDSQSITIDGEAPGIPFTIENVPDWLTVSSNSGSTPLTVTVTASSNSLQTGVYHGNLQIQGENTNTIVIPITLAVSVASDYQLIFSENSQRNFSEPLQSAIVSGDIFVFTTPDEEVDQVSFYLDDPSATGQLLQLEKNPPFDLKGTQKDGSAYPLDTTTLSDGQHTVTAVFDFNNGTQLLKSSLFTVSNTGPQLITSPSQLAFELVQPVVQDSSSIMVSFSDGSSVPFSATNASSWLNLSTANAITPANIVLDIDASQLAPGFYSDRIDLIAENGSTDSVQVELSVAPPFVPSILSVNQLSLQVSEESPTLTTNIDISTNDGVSASISAVSTAGWLTVQPASGVSPFVLQAHVDASSLQPGPYSGEINLTSGSHGNQSITVNLDVFPEGATSAYSLLVSSSSNRSNPTPLNNSMISQPVYIFTSPDNPVISSVDFYVDSLSSSRIRRENTAPYDLGGGTVLVVRPWDPSSIGAGIHTVYAVINFNDGTSETINSVFEVQ